MPVSVACHNGRYLYDGQCIPFKWASNIKGATCATYGCQKPVTITRDPLTHKISIVHTHSPVAVCPRIPGSTWKERQINRAKCFETIKRFKLSIRRCAVCNRVTSHKKLFNMPKMYATHKTHIVTEKNVPYTIDLFLAKLGFHGEVRRKDCICPRETHLCGNKVLYYEMENFVKHDTNKQFDSDPNIYVDSSETTYYDTCTYHDPKTVEPFPVLTNKCSKCTIKFNQLDFTKEDRVRLPIRFKDGSHCSIGPSRSWKQNGVVYLLTYKPLCQDEQNKLLQYYSTDKIIHITIPSRDTPIKSTLLIDSPITSELCSKCLYEERKLHPVCRVCKMHFNEGTCSTCTALFLNPAVSIMTQSQRCIYKFNGGNLAVPDPMEEYSACFLCENVCSSSSMARFPDYLDWPCKNIMQSLFTIGNAKFICEYCIKPCADCFFPIYNDKNHLLCKICLNRRKELESMSLLLTAKQHAKITIDGHTMW